MSSELRKAFGYKFNQVITPSRYRFVCHYISLRETALMLLWNHLEGFDQLYRKLKTNTNAGETALMLPWT